MTVERSYTINKITFNSVAYDVSSGGPLAFSFGHSGRTILDRTGDDIYSPCVIIPEKDVTASFRLRDISTLLVPGAAKADLTFRVKVAGRPDTMYDLIFHDMVMNDTDGSLTRSVPGEGSFSFSHEHTDSNTITKASVP
jgi:hypothetical protein